jgi:hypothetical protein
LPLEGICPIRLANRWLSPNRFGISMGWSYNFANQLDWLNKIVFANQFGKLKANWFGISIKPAKQIGESWRNKGIYIVIRDFTTRFANLTCLLSAW